MRSVKKEMRTARVLLAVLLLCGLLLSSCAAKAGTANGAASRAGGDAEGTEQTSGTDDRSPAPDDPGGVSPSANDSGGDPGPRLSCRRENDGGIIACWWWNRGRATSRALREKYLDFLAENDVNRVYLCLPDFTHEQLSAFVRSAGERSISVALLTGDAAFLEPENGLADRVIAEYLAYQASAAPEEKLDGIHFDVEPHQRPDFAEKRDEILELYAAFVLKAAARLRDAGERVEWDIPFWFDQFNVHTTDGESVSLLELLAQNADLLCLMSYRNTADAVTALSAEEIAVCVKYGIGVICGVDAYSGEGDDVSFAKKGKAAMYRVIGSVYRRLARTQGIPTYGVAIHYLDTWYDLKD